MLFPKNKADLRLRPGLQDDSSIGQKVLFFPHRGLIPVVAKREMSDWLSSNHTPLRGAFKISGRNVQIAVYWQRRGWCVTFSGIIRTYLCSELISRVWNSLHSTFVGLCFTEWHILDYAPSRISFNFDNFWLRLQINIQIFVWGSSY